MLGAPPAFVLSQDQTLYKWYLSLKSVKSLFAQHAITCVLCELLCLELFNVFFQHENRFRYKFFDIVQFSRSCLRLSQAADDLIILSQKWFFVKLFFRSFFAIRISSANLERSQFLGAGRNFRTSIGSFRFTSSWDSEVILLSQRVALKYNTIRRATLQVFFTSFLLFFRFCIHPLVFCLKSVPALAPTQHTCGVRLLPLGGGVAPYIIRRASAAFTGQTDALSYI